MLFPLFSTTALVDISVQIYQSNEKKRRNFTADFKLKIVLEALKERESLNELAQKHQRAQLRSGRSLL
jgi:transposase-like protein